MSDIYASVDSTITMLDRFVINCRAGFSMVVTAHSVISAVVVSASMVVSTMVVPASLVVAVVVVPASLQVSSIEF